MTSPADVLRAMAVRVGPFIPNKLVVSDLIAVAEYIDRIEMENLRFRIENGLQRDEIKKLKLAKPDKPKGAKK